MVVDTVNNGTIQGIPPDAVIEATCLINRSGAVPLSVEKLPQWMEQWLQLVCAYQNLTVKAGAEGDYNALVHAFYINPTTPSGEQAAALINEMIFAHKKYLPQFINN